LRSPYRLLHPLRRKGRRGGGEWEPLSWEKALDEVAARLAEAKEKYGAEAVCLAKGLYQRHSDYVSRLGNVFGTPNVTSIDNTCYIPSAVGRLVTYGFDGMPDVGGGPECLLLWGTSADPPLLPDARLVVVDALESTAAEKADLWLRPRPGSDLALALGLLYVIVQEKLYDQGFVTAWTYGFERLEEHVRAYPPEKVAALTWVPPEKIVAASRLFAAARPGCLWNGNATEDTLNGTQCARAFAILQAICGNLDVPGGTVHVEGTLLAEGTDREVLRHLLPPEQEAKKLGAEAGYVPAHPLWDAIAWKPGEVHPQHVVTSILEGKPYPLQVLAIFGSNPLLTWPHSKRVHQALLKVPFLVVADLVMTPTAALADVVLPVASYLETNGVEVTRNPAGAFCLEPQQKVVQIGECRSDLEIISGLAARLGLGEYFAPDLESLLDRYLAPMGMTFRELRRHPGAVCSATKYRKYLEKGFATPSGKVELWSQLCATWGYDPLPVYREQPDTPLSAPELLPEYPLVLTSAHEPEYVHSQDRYLPTLRAKRPEPLVVLHPQTAEGLGVAEGDWVYIESRQGRVRQKATLDLGIDPRVVSVAHGWWFPERGEADSYGWEEANLNILTDDGPPYGPEMGSPRLRGFLCRVYKAE